MAFDPMVEAIRSALRAVDRNPGSASAYLDLIDAYALCADKEGELELLEQAGYVTRDVKSLPLTDEQRQRLAALETRVVAVRARIQAGVEKP